MTNPIVVSGYTKKQAATGSYFLVKKTEPNFDNLCFLRTNNAICPAEPDNPGGSIWFALGKPSDWRFGARGIHIPQRGSQGARVSQPR